MRPIFDRLVMVDWSARDGRAAGRESCIWIAHGDAGAAEPAAESPASRSEAVQRLAELLAPPARVLAGFDFGFGYPRGLAAHLPAAPAPDLPWRRVWRWLAAELQDDLGAGSRLPTNRSNRFDVAARLNARLRARGGPEGPFWCLCRAGSHPHVPQRRPPQPFPTGLGAAIAPRRPADDLARAGSPFRLFGHGSVGGQVLTGIPRLEALRSSIPGCAVWPFDTGWAGGDGFPPPGVRVVLAEVYPSLLAPLPDPVLDRGQVRALWRGARDLDRRGRLTATLARPPSLEAGSPDEIAARVEEGWIWGAGRGVR